MTARPAARRLPVHQGVLQVGVAGISVAVFWVAVPT